MPDSSVMLKADDQDERVAIALVDGTTLFREGVLRILSGTRFHVSRHIGDLDGLADARPDADIELAIVSLQDDPAATVEQMAELHVRRPDLHLVALADSFDPDTLRRCFRAGVDGFLLKTISSRALLSSLELVMLGEKVFPRQLVNLILPPQQAGSSGMPRHGDLRKLSEREMEILRCLVAGHSNKVIAARLSITEATVKVHLKSILRKIGAANRTQAAIWALNNGVQPLEPAA
jgi:two-component system nitrate/nitrite response regulator NarL